MIIAVLAEDAAKAALLSRDRAAEVSLIWADSVRSLVMIEADLYIDLSFEYNNERISRLRPILPKPVIVNEVVHTTSDLGLPFARLNGWPTMIDRPVLELAAAQRQPVLEEMLKKAGWSFQFVPDIVGMITPRIVSMIINEAWFTLDAGTASREDIDTAMKLGTNYPFGPFEWGEKIGLARIRELLRELGRSDSRYTIAPGLK